VLGYHIYKGSKVIGTLVLIALSTPAALLVGGMVYAIYKGIKAAK
jgi:hypothetical protein